MLQMRADRIPLRNLHPLSLLIIACFKFTVKTALAWFAQSFRFFSKRGLTESEGPFIILLVRANNARTNFGQDVRFY